MFSRKLDNLGQKISYGVLVLALVLGGALRAEEAERNFGINNGFEYFVEMASHFFQQPGGYNFEKGLQIRQNPDQYVFTGNPDYLATGSFENEKGWALVLRLILPEGGKGVSTLARTVLRYQIILDLFVIVMLFFAGRSIGGHVGGSIAALLYALFLPSISLVTWVSYYYWTIPFSAASLLFWTTIYNPKIKDNSERKYAITFFLYGVLIGFATFIRLSFLLLPIAMAVLVFSYGPRKRKTVILLVAMFIGMGSMLLPQVLITDKWYGEKVLTNRATYHHVIQGLGAHVNPLGLRNSEDLTVVDWAISRGGPDLNKEGIVAYDEFLKRETFRLIQEYPWLFVKNLEINLFRSVTMTGTSIARYCCGPRFAGLIDSSTNEYTRGIDYSRGFLLVAYSFPWVVLTALFLTLLFSRKNLWPLLAAIAQGAYFVAVPAIYFPPGDVHNTSFFPVYVLLWAGSIGLIIRILLKGLNMTFMSGLYREDLRTKESISAAVKVGQDGKSLELYSKNGLVWVITVSCLIAVVWSSNGWVASRNVVSISDSTAAKLVDSRLKAELDTSFEFWGDSGANIPKGWRHFNSQSDSKSFLRVNTAKENVEHGSRSAELSGNRVGDSAIAYTLPPDLLYSILGKTVTVRASVKSANTSPGEVGLVVRNGVNPRKWSIESYSNSGKWETLTLHYRVPKNIEFFTVWLGVGGHANASAYFDNIQIAVEPTVNF